VIHVVVKEPGHGFEASLIAPQLVEHRIGPGKHVGTVDQIQRNQAVRVLVGQWPQQQRAHQAEDCRVRANAQSQRQHRNGCKTRILPEHSERVTNISDHANSY
jgi:hypothetical protein